ncbi:MULTISPECIES: DUF559 domain-containing protein [unclassified Adlercreutzia]|uniref:DUF559 domain-containing protein n=1 Tax=unclassified Adlercreutzia TaxID=2636013 RepID=UPI0013EE168F|nr:MULTISPECIES: DUF559 domain-containing protein [unclassified Adlercreutzia]
MLLDLRVSCEGQQHATAFAPNGEIAALIRHVPAEFLRRFAIYLLDLDVLFDGAAPRRALAQVHDGSASPRETDLVMRIALPSKWGGYGIGGARLNHRIEMGARAQSQTSQSYYVADMCWPEKKLVVEYDSDLHLTSSGIAHDAAKRRALEAAGYKVITVTRLQLDSLLEMDRIARAIARHLGIRLRPQAADFKQRQSALFSARA